VLVHGRRFLRFSPSGALLADRPVPRALRQYRLVHGGDLDAPTIFIPTATGLCACDADGLVRWRLRTDGPVSYSLAALAGGRVAVACKQYDPAGGRAQIKVAAIEPTFRLAWSHWAGPMSVDCGLWVATPDGRQIDLWEPGLGRWWRFGGDGGELLSWVPSAGETDGPGGAFFYRRGRPECFWRGRWWQLDPDSDVEVICHLPGIELGWVPIAVRGDGRVVAMLLDEQHRWLASLSPSGEAASIVTLPEAVPEHGDDYLLDCEDCIVLWDGRCLRLLDGAEPWRQRWHLEPAGAAPVGGRVAIVAPETILLSLADGRCIAVGAP